MTDAWLSAAILLFALALFVSDRVRPDLVALMALFLTVLTGLVRPADAFAGFADPAVIAVAAVLIAGRALETSGVVGAITSALMPRKAPFGVRLAGVLLGGAVLSAFMNNIAALVITMPIALGVARDARRSPSAVLMPLAFATILGGMTTLIGTPANLILSSVRAEALGEGFGFFAMTPVGGAVALVGLAYLGLVGRHLIPTRKSSKEPGRPAWRVYELELGAGVRPAMIRTVLRKAGARLLATLRGSSNLQDGELPARGDRLLVLSRRPAIETARESKLVNPAGPDIAAGEVTARVSVAHGSFLVGRSHNAVVALSDGRVRVVAAGPRAAAARVSLAMLRIAPGDQLFIRGTPDALAAFVQRGRLLEVDREDVLPLKGPAAWTPVLIFAAAIVAIVSGVVGPALAFLMAAAAIAGLGYLRPEEIYRAVDWPIIILLAAMIPVGTAFETSGAADIAANTIGTALANASPFEAYAAICAGTLLLSIMLNNVATALIMGPIAIQLSGPLGIPADAALLAVLIGTSSDFLTPIGHQNNLLVMGPGGYRFTDYARVGLPLAVAVVLTTAWVLTYL